MKTSSLRLQRLVKLGTSKLQILADWSGWSMATAIPWIWVFRL